MKIAVCLGVVPDTTTKVRFTDNDTKFDTNGVQWVINPWDELALTRALELKEDASTGVKNVTVITVGEKDAEPTMRKALAIGADNAIRVDAAATEPFAIAAQLAEVLKKEAFDIVIAGIETSDYNGSAIGSMVAEYLELPSVSAVSGMNIEGGKVIMSRDIDGGKETVEAATPVVAVVQKGITKEPRIPSMRGIMMARKKPLQVEAAAASDAMSEFVSFEMPPAKAACKMIEADDMKALVDALHNDAKVI